MPESRTSSFLDECAANGIFVLIDLPLGEVFWNKNLWDRQSTDSTIRREINWYTKVYQEVIQEVANHPAVMGFNFNNGFVNAAIAYQDPTLATFFWNQATLFAVYTLNHTIYYKMRGITFPDDLALINGVVQSNYVDMVNRSYIDYFGVNVSATVQDANTFGQIFSAFSSYPNITPDLRPVIATVGWPQSTRKIWDTTCPGILSITDTALFVTDAVAGDFYILGSNLVTPTKLPGAFNSGTGIVYHEFSDNWYRQGQNPSGPKCVQNPACTWIGTYTQSPSRVPGGWYDSAAFGIFSVQRPGGIPNCSPTWTTDVQSNYYGPNLDYDQLAMGTDGYSRSPLRGELISLYASVSNNASQIVSFRFNGNAKDNSGNNFHGIVNGATLTTDRFGFPNSAYEFDGNDAINANLPPLGYAYSISAWVLGYDENTSRREIISGGGQNTANGYFVYRQSKQYRSDISNIYGPAGAASATSLEWAHVAVVSDGTSIRLYVDGVLQSTVNAHANILSGPLSIGKIFFPSSFSGGWIGKIDDVSIYRGCLSAAEISALSADRPVARYVFNANYIDESGNHRHVTVFGASATSDRFGVLNRSYSFDGVNDEISYGSVPALGAQYSITAWVYSDDANATRREILSGGATATNNGYYLYRHNGQYRTDVSNVYGPVGSSGIKTGQWVHLGVVARNNTVELYVDGILQSTKQMSPNISAGPLSIGKTFFSFSGSTYWKGKIDDVTIHRRPLTGTEMTKLSSDRPGGQVIARSAVVEESPDQAEEVEVSKELTFYPNPTKGEVGISYRSGKVSDLNIQVLDLAGSVLANIKAADKAGEQGFAVINLKNPYGLNPGVYLIRFVGGSKHLGTKRIVLE